MTDCISGYFPFGTKLSSGFWLKKYTLFSVFIANLFFKENWETWSAGWRLGSAQACSSAVGGRHGVMRVVAFGGTRTMRSLLPPFFIMPGAAARQRIMGAAMLGIGGPKPPKA